MNLAERILEVLNGNSKWMTPSEIGYVLLGDQQPVNKLEEELFRRVMLPRIVEELAKLSKQGIVEVATDNGRMICRVRGKAVMEGCLPHSDDKKMIGTHSSEPPRCRGRLALLRHVPIECFSCSYFKKCKEEVVKQ